MAAMRPAEAGVGETPLVSVNGKLSPASDARISVFDPGFLRGEALIEEVRFELGRLAFLDAHVERLRSGARMLGFELGLSGDALARRMFECLDANGMRDLALVRVLASRGAPGAGPTIVIAPEPRQPLDAIARGLRLFTTHVRRHDLCDARLNVASDIPGSMARGHAALGGADLPLALNAAGHVAGTASGEIFVVRNGELMTPRHTTLAGGIVGGAVLRAARAAGIPVVERDFTLIDVYSADEVFATESFDGVLPVRSVDGREIGEPSGNASDASGPMTRWLRDLYREIQDEESRVR